MLLGIDFVWSYARIRGLALWGFWRMFVYWLHTHFFPNCRQHSSLLPGFRRFMLTTVPHSETILLEQVALPTTWDWAPAVQAACRCYTHGGCCRWFLSSGRVACFTRFCHLFLSSVMPSFARWRFLEIGSELDWQRFPLRSVSRWSLSRVARWSRSSFLG